MLKLDSNKIIFYRLQNIDEGEKKKGGGEVISVKFD